MGYAGNANPDFIVPTAIATKDDIARGDFVRAKDGMEDLDFFIGDEAVSNRSTYAVNYPIRHGVVENWNNMERLWQRCLFQHLRCDPEEHFVLLVRRPLSRASVRAQAV